MVLLEVKGIKKTFGGVVALSDGNLKCRQGRITGLLGANGSGKSTISKIITGTYKADSGEILYQGNSVRFRNPNEARKAGIAMVYQNLSLVPDLTVWQNVVLGAEQKNGLFLDNLSARNITRGIVDQLQPGLDIDRMVYDLNPGEMQIVEIAKAVSTNPQMLILDEPTAALEQEQVKNLFRYMRKLVAAGVAINFTSHRLWEVMEICDEVTIFRNGHNVADINFEIDGKDPEKIIGFITGEAGKVRTARKKTVISNDELLSIEHMNYSTLLRDVSFTLRKGEVLGIGGLAGQGQHELMLALAGKYAGISCRARLKGKDLKLTKPGYAIKNNILLVPGDRQTEGLFLKHSVLFNTIFPRLGLKGHPLFLPLKKYRRECQEITGILSVKTAGIDMPVNTLSGGNQQKVVVGKWLPFDTNVLLLADPAKGVDVGAKRDLYDYILKMVQEKNMSIILYASDNEELIEYCDRVLIMYEGQVVETLSGEDINEDTIITASMRLQQPGEV